jgi:hypothetical protein
MAELADAHGSGPCGLTAVEVRIFLRAPDRKRDSDFRVSFLFLSYINYHLSYCYVAFDIKPVRSCLYTLMKPGNIKPSGLCLHVSHSSGGRSVSLYKTCFSYCNIGLRSGESLPEPSFQNERYISSAYRTYPAERFFAARAAVEYQAVRIL